MRSHWGSPLSSYIYFIQAVSCFVFLLIYNKRVEITVMSLHFLKLSRVVNEKNVKLLLVNEFWIKIGHSSKFPWLSPIFNIRFPVTSVRMHQPWRVASVKYEGGYFTGGGGAEGQETRGVGEGGWGLMLGWYLKINFGLLKIWLGLPEIFLGQQPCTRLKIIIILYCFHLIGNKR